MLSGLFTSTNSSTTDHHQRTDDGKKSYRPSARVVSASLVVGMLVLRGTYHFYLLDRHSFPMFLSLNSSTLILLHHKYLLYSNTDTNQQLSRTQLLKKSAKTRLVEERNIVIAATAEAKLTVAEGDIRLLLPLRVVRGGDAIANIAIVEDVGMEGEMVGSEKTEDEDTL